MKLKKAWKKIDVYSIKTKSNCHNGFDMFTNDCQPQLYYHDDDDDGK